MSDQFELPVTFHGNELLLPAEFLPMGYTHKIRVTVEQVDVLFEPDEEKNYRAVVGDADRDKVSKLDAGLLRAICETLDGLFGSAS